MGALLGALLEHHMETMRKKNEAFAGNQALFEKALQGGVPREMGYAAWQGMKKHFGKGSAEALAPMDRVVEQTMGPTAAAPQAAQLRTPQLPAPPQGQPAADGASGGAGEPVPGILGAEFKPPTPPPATVPPPPSPENAATGLLQDFNQPVSLGDWFTPQGQGMRELQKGIPAMALQIGMDPIQIARAVNRLRIAGVDPNQLNIQQFTAYLKGGEVPYVPTTAVKPGDILSTVTGQQLTSGAPRLITTPQGATTSAVPTAGDTGNPGIPPPPGTQPSVIASSPPLLSKDEANMVAAAQRVAAQRGFPFDPAKNPRQPLLQVPPQYQTEVQMAADPMLQIRADNLRELRAQRALRSQELALRVKDFNLTHSPEYIQSFVNMMKDDPDLYFDQALNSVRPQVSQAWQQETGLPVPRKLGQQMKTGEETSNIALQHIDLVKQLLQDPAIQKRIGPVLGRLGNLEETAGMTVGLSPEESQKIQKFRTALNYLYFREGRSLMGGRPPERLMQLFAKASVSPKEAMPLLLGSLGGAEAAAKSTIEAADKYRFGGKSRTAGSAGTPAPTSARPRAQDAQGNVVEWNGSAWAPVPK